VASKKKSASHVKGWETRRRNEREREREEARLARERSERAKRGWETRRASLAPPPPEAPKKRAKKAAPKPRGEAEKPRKKGAPKPRGEAEKVKRRGATILPPPPKKPAKKKRRKKRTPTGYEGVEFPFGRNVEPSNRALEDEKKRLRVEQAADRLPPPKVPDVDEIDESKLHEVSGHFRGDNPFWVLKAADERAELLGIRDVRVEGEQILGTDLHGMTRRAYAVYSKDTGQMVVYWSHPDTIAGYTPDNFKEAYEEFDEDNYQIEFEWEFFEAEAGQ
jgi:hypothetical protein